MVERRVRNPEVRGTIPGSGSIFFLRSDNINSNHRKSTNYCRERSSCVTCIVFQLGQSYIRANFWQGVHNSTASMYIANRDRKQSSPLGKFSRSHAGRAGMTNGGSGGRTSCPD